MTTADVRYLVASGGVVLLVAFATFSSFLRGAIVAVVGYFLWRRFAPRLGLVRRTS